MYFISSSFHLHLKLITQMHFYVVCLCLNVPPLSQFSNGQFGYLISMEIIHLLYHSICYCFCAKRENLRAQIYLICHFTPVISREQSYMNYSAYIPSFDVTSNTLRNQAKHLVSLHKLYPAKHTLSEVLVGGAFRASPVSEIGLLSRVNKYWI